MVPSSSRPFVSLALLIVLFLPSLCAFAPPKTVASLRLGLTASTSCGLASSATDESNSFADDMTQRFQLFQTSRAEGYDFKQSTAIAIAGKYDAVEVQNKIKESIASAPCVIFTWEASPSCKKAIKYLDIAGATYKIVRLDDPWSEGNPLRAELGKMVGRSSVPVIFMGGQYVGGFDGGVGEESPGILDMAFKGTLREKLKEVGAL
jgi:glutaredoxin 3